MDSVRIGIIGVGGMGKEHCKNISNINEAKLTAICDIDHATADTVAAKYSCKAWYDSTALIESGEVDAVIIATPHYGHTTIGIAALKQGLHVLVEKPISVHKADCERLIAAHTNKKQVFAAMFNQRTDPFYIKVRELVHGGEIGELIRVNWIVTSWFRTEAYYRSSDWRATWKGEGGGVLLNQCPHNLDLLCWICGMPTAIRAFCKMGSEHDIEVEDSVTAYLEFPGNATGVFISSTGECPGTNRLEICGTRGKVLVENDSINFIRNTIPSRQYCKESTQLYEPPPVWNISIPAPNHGGQHLEISQNFVDAILHGKPLIAPAAEGIRSVEIANGMIYSSQTNSTVSLPLDGVAYEKMLKKLIAESKFQKVVKKPVATDIRGSF